MENAVKAVISFCETPAVHKVAVIGFPLMLAVMIVHVVARSQFGIVLF